MRPRTALAARPQVAQDAAARYMATMAHGTTVTAVAAELGVPAALAWADHIIETLEGNLRTELEDLRVLATLVVEGQQPVARVIAAKVLELVALRDASEREKEK